MRKTGPQRPKVVMDDAEQSQRFIEAARELGCEEDLGRLDEALRRIANAGAAPRNTVKRPGKKSRQSE
jgi:hypothetical protein